MHARRIVLVMVMAFAGPVSAAASGPQVIEVHPFALLPADFRNPESIATDPVSGEIYVGSFDAREPESERNNQILRLSPDGKVLARARLGRTPITGLAHFGSHIYFLNFGASSLQKLPADFRDGATPVDVATFAALDPPAPPSREVANPDGTADRIQFGSAGFPAINGLAFDRSGNAYVSDSFQGAIYRIRDAATCERCPVEVLARDGLLATTGALPFGANGLAIDESSGQLYVNNAGDGRVLRLPLRGGRIEVLADGVYGADGLLLHEGLLWVAANQIDTVVALDLHGKVRARAGSFQGIAADGTPVGLLFPAATAVQGRRMIVANLALPLTPAAGDEWEEQVSRWNLAAFDIPPDSER
jgi:DNA-binding beta-propeller fold protein YncE